MKRTLRGQNTPNVGQPKSTKAVYIIVNFTKNANITVMTFELYDSDAESLLSVGLRLRLHGWKI